MGNRFAIALPLLALVAACQQGQSGHQSKPEMMQVEEMAADAAAPGAPPPVAVSREANDAGPNIGVTSAPGIAFNYRYAFRLPNAKIASVQEAHAQMCEKLGVNRCRITGMRYTLVDEDEVSAMLAFKLDPAIARQFGKDGIALVTGADGMLVDSEISGVDAGGAIKAADKSIAQLQDDLNRVEARLREKLSNEERLRLSDEADMIRQQMRAARDDRAASKESLATTPMIFNYGSGSVIPGFDGASPVAEAFKTAWASFLMMLGFIIVAIGVVLPWAALALAGLWLYRRFGNRIRPVAKTDA